jgi:hypothetical protein
VFPFLLLFLVCAAEGHWEQVCDAAQLTPQQEDTLAAGFNWYAQRRSELIVVLEQHVAQLQQLLEPLYAGDGSAVSAAAVLGLGAGPGLTMESAEQLQVGAAAPAAAAAGLWYY